LLQEWYATEDSQTIPFGDTADYRVDQSSDVCSYLEDGYFTLEEVAYNNLTSQHFSAWLTAILERPDDTEETADEDEAKAEDNDEQIEDDQLAEVEEDEFIYEDLLFGEISE